MLGPTFAAGGNAFLRFLFDELKHELEFRFAMNLGWAKTKEECADLIV
jgi:hypothetical protein